MSLSLFCLRSLPNQESSKSVPVKKSPRGVPAGGDTGESESEQRGDRRDEGGRLHLRKHKINGNL